MSIRSGGHCFKSVLTVTNLFSLLLIVGIIYLLSGILNFNTAQAKENIILLNNVTTLTSASKNIQNFEEEKNQIKNQPEEKWRTVTMRVTAYCPCEKCCGEFADGITASGRKIQQGDTFVAADSQFAFNTQMIIPGYNNDKPVKVFDRGSAIQGEKLDLFFHTHQEALEWGVKYLQVKIKENPF